MYIKLKFLKENLIELFEVFMYAVSIGFELPHGMYMPLSSLPHRLPQHLAHPGPRPHWQATHLSHWVFLPGTQGGQEAFT